MPFTITIIETFRSGTLPVAEEPVIERYRQTVDTINLPEIISTINRAPRKPRADKGQVRK